MAQRGAYMTDEQNQKAAFAALLLREPQPFKAALMIFPDNTNRALRIANEWPNDPEVKAEMDRLVNDEAESLLMTKAQFLLSLEQRMKGTVYPDGLVVPLNTDDFTKVAKLYAETRGFIEKPQTNVNVQAAIVHRVIESPVFPSEHAWEMESERQQRELLANARTRN